MDKNQIKKLIEHSKYVFIGDIHGTKEIPEKIFEIIRSILKKKKIIFCLELPQQAEKELYAYLNKKMSEKEFLQSKYLEDALFDHRIDKDRLSLYKKLYENNVILRCLENYDLENINERDKVMAMNFMELIQEHAEQYFVYVGGMHIIDEEIEIMGMKVKPLKIYLPKNISEDTLIIQFENSEKEEIDFTKENNTLHYKLILKEIKANSIKM